MQESRQSDPVSLWRLRKSVLRKAIAMGRVSIAFCFGLVHGLGFAGALREIGLGANGSSIALPLCSFNLGVEIGQICIAGIALPLLWLIRRTRTLDPFVTPTVSIAVIFMGSFWLILRLWP